MVTLQAATKLPTHHGTFTVQVYTNAQNEEITAVCSGHIQHQQHLAVRLHSACFTAEVLGSLKCDCKQQLDYGLSYIAEHGGVVIYLPQEGRGIGLANKIRAYALQEQGYDTIEANTLLNLPVDGRRYDDAKAIIAALEIQSVRILTNNPLKLQSLTALGITVSGRIPVPVVANHHSIAYLDTKKKLMGHMLSVRTTIAEQDHSAQSRPMVHVNFALSERGQLTDTQGSNLPISCEQDWQRVHQLRERYHGIAVGANTWNNDHPSLTARAEWLGRPASKQPTIILFAGKTYCDLQHRPDQSIITVGSQAQTTSLQHQVINTEDHDLSYALHELAEQGIESLLVEGGSQLIQTFFNQNKIDLMTIYVNTECITSAINAAVTAVPELDSDCIEAQYFGQGILLSIMMKPELETLLIEQQVVNA